MKPYTLEWWLAKKDSAYKRAFGYEDEWRWAIEYYTEDKGYYWGQAVRYVELMEWINERIINKYGE